MVYGGNVFLHPGPYSTHMHHRSTFYTLRSDHLLHPEGINGTNPSKSQQRTARGAKDTCSHGSRNYLGARYPRSVNFILSSILSTKGESEDERSHRCNADHDDGFEETMGGG